MQTYYESLKLLKRVTTVIWNRFVNVWRSANTQVLQQMFYNVLFSLAFSFLFCCSACSFFPSIFLSQSVCSKLNSIQIYIWARLMVDHYSTAECFWKCMCEHVIAASGCCHDNRLCARRITVHNSITDQLNREIKCNSPDDNSINQIEKQNSFRIWV